MNGIKRFDRIRILNCSFDVIANRLQFSNSVRSVKVEIGCCAVASLTIPIAPSNLERLQIAFSFDSDICTTTSIRLHYRRCAFALLSGHFNIIIKNTSKPITTNSRIFNVFTICSYVSVSQLSLASDCDYFGMELLSLCP